MFYFIHVQGQNALTTLLHLADDGISGLADILLLESCKELGFNACLPTV